MIRTFSEAQTSFAKRSILPSEWIKSTLDKVKCIEKLNAFISLNRTDNLTAAGAAADRRWADGKPLGPIDGITVAVKDNFCVKGTATTCGSNMLRNFVAPYDATVVERTTNGGAVVVGKTNLDEFAMGSGGIDSAFGPVKSLWKSGIPLKLTGRNTSKAQVVSNDAIGLDSDDWIISGGSSSGSAVAVASGVCLAALGSDTGGSVRIPGAWNGIVTLKPTYGALSRHGLIPLVNSLDVPGIMTRCVDDAETLFGVLANGSDHRDSTCIGEKDRAKSKKVEDMTVGIPLEYHCQDMSREVLQAWSDIIDMLENEGVRVRRVSLPHTSYAITCYSVLNPCEVASNMARYDGLEYGLRGSSSYSTEEMYAESRRKGFNEVVRGRILAGNYFLQREVYSKYFLKALKVRRLVSEDFRRVFEMPVDLLLTPVTLSAAPTFKAFSSMDNRTQTTKQDYCTQPVNLAGLPAATVPVALSSQGLPLSLQVIAPMSGDRNALALCRWIEERVNFPLVNLA